MKYRNPKHLGDGRIDCEIEHPEHGWVPFTADPADVGARFDVAELHAAMTDDPNTEPYVPPTQEQLDAEAAVRVRAMRDHILKTVVDPFVSNPLRWGELSEEAQKEWADYRRELLAVPEQHGFPHAVVWPAGPKGSG